MDPNVTLALLNTALGNGNERDAQRYVDILREWLRNGGFEPRWRDPGVRGSTLDYLKSNGIRVPHRNSCRCYRCVPDTNVF